MQTSPKWAVGTADLRFIDIRHQWMSEDNQAVGLRPRLNKISPNVSLAPGHAERFCGYHYLGPLMAGVRWHRTRGCIMSVCGHSALGVMKWRPWPQAMGGARDKPRRSTECNMICVTREYWLCWSHNSEYISHLPAVLWLARPVKLSLLFKVEIYMMPPIYTPWTDCFVHEQICPACVHEMPDRLIPRRCYFISYRDWN